MPDALFYGSGTALVTPFAGEEVDYGAWEHLIEWQIDAGTDALIVLGSTGEGPCVEFEERQRLVSIAVSVSGGRVPVIVSAGSNCTKHACALATNARELGADGILLSTPYYNKPTSDGIRMHFVKVADAGGLPMIAYNIPSRTGVNISPSLMADLARHPLIRGLKEASTDVNHIAETIDTLADGFAVYAGNDAMTLPVMAGGGRGVISVTGNLFPREMASLTHAMLRDDLQTARRSNERLSRFFAALSVEVNPGPVKYAMSLRGMCESTMRLPLSPVSAHTRARIREALDEMNAI